MDTAENTLSPSTLQHCVWYADYNTQLKQKVFTYATPGLTVMESYTVIKFCPGNVSMSTILL